MQNLSRRNFLKVGAAGASVGFLRAHASPASAATAGSKRGGTFTLARTASIQDFNGVNLIMGHFAFIRALYNTLVRLDKDLNPQPELAESWQFSPDGLTMTLKLRGGVNFHSGRDFGSEDVRFSWEFSTDKTTGSPQMRELFSLIKDVKMPDKYTVELKFDKPNPLVFDALDTLCMFDRTRVDKLGQADAGSGPFQVVGYRPGGDVLLKRFDAYWEADKPSVDEYTIRQVPDAGAMVLNLESKAVDAIWGVPLHEVARLGALPGLLADPGPPAPNIYQLMVNVRSEPLSNKKVRQAISHAIDRERICKTILHGTVKPTWLMWPKGSWAYFGDLEGRYPYNLDKAKALLAEAGYPNGFETSITCSQKIMAAQMGIAQIIQADLAKIGIRSKIIDLEPVVYVSRVYKGEFLLQVHNYGRINRDPGTMLGGAVVWYPKGPTGFEYADFTKWRDEAATSLDREKRKVLYRNIQELALEECFINPIAPQQQFCVYRDYVKGLWFNREGVPFVGDLWLDK